MMEYLLLFFVVGIIFILGFIDIKDKKSFE